MDLNKEQDDLAKQRLTADNFSSFYRMIMGLRFPIDVADVIEMRGTINHTLDTFEVPSQMRHKLHFVEALKGAIGSFGIENKHHVNRLIRILTMFRELHHLHNAKSRHDEADLRQLQANNRAARSQSMFYGLAAITATSVISLIWYGLAEAGWYIKLAAVVTAYITWDYFHSMTTLDREYKILTAQLNDLLRERVQSVNWKVLIHKLALILGYKKVSGVNVFLMGDNTDLGDNPHTYH